MENRSRQDILNALRSCPIEAPPLPELTLPVLQFDRPREQFAQVLEAVGGRALTVRDAAELNARLEEMPAYRAARKICSLVPGVTKANVDLSGVTDPHQLEDADFFIAPGEFAVAENGAVWLTDAALRHRVLYFIAQHVALVVPAANMVHNLHEAYARLSFGERQFGLFLSGPSKTADIEQALVIGAHGARSLTVFLLDQA
jgi:L-lactate dehydrogenase complex protein LldG